MSTPPYSVVRRLKIPLRARSLLAAVFLMPIGAVAHARVEISLVGVSVNPTKDEPAIRRLLGPDYVQLKQGTETVYSAANWGEAAAEADINLLRRTYGANNVRVTVSGGAAPSQKGPERRPVVKIADWAKRARNAFHVAQEDSPMVVAPTPTASVPAPTKTASHTTKPVCKPTFGFLGCPSGTNYLDDPPLPAEQSMAAGRAVSARADSVSPKILKGLARLKQLMANPGHYGNGDGFVAYQLEQMHDNDLPDIDKLFAGEVPAEYEDLARAYRKRPQLRPGIKVVSQEAPFRQLILKMAPDREIALLLTAIIQVQNPKWDPDFAVRGQKGLVPLPPLQDSSMRYLSSSASIEAGIKRLVFLRNDIPRRQGSALSGQKLREMIVYEFNLGRYDMELAPRKVAEMNRILDAYYTLVAHGTRPAIVEN